MQQILDALPLGMDTVEQVQLCYWSGGQIPGASVQGHNP